MSRSRARRPGLVLDKEAVQLLLPARQHDCRRRAFLATIEVAATVRTPTAVRVEAGADRSSAHALLARLTTDVDLDAAAADRAIALGRSAGAGDRPSPVDLSVAVEAERVASSKAFSKVEVLTSDVAGLERLAGMSGAPFAVVAL